LKGQTCAGPRATKQPAGAAWTWFVIALTASLGASHRTARPAPDPLFLVLPTVLFSFIAVQVYSGEGAEATTAAQQVAWFIGSWLIPGFTAALVTVFFALFIRRQRINARLRRGNAASVALWSAAWFCHRCGGVFFPAGTPLEVPTEQLLPAVAFRQLVWTTAGYRARRTFSRLRG
jgi:hypothetical protein